jgi:nicastrin
MAKIEVNSTLVSEMLSCISSDWHCDLMKAYSQPIISTMIEYLSLTDSAWPSYSKPSTLYPSVLDSDRSMLIKSGDSTYYSLFNATWSEDSNRVNLFPNAYEVFTRAFLASAMLPTSDAKTATACSQSQTCGDSGTGKECVYPGVCADQRAYYHEASSPGLTRTTTALLYDVVNDSLPIWTEPKWDTDIGSYAFPDPGTWIGWISLLVGVAATGVAVVLSKMLLASVHKMKLM